MKKDYGEFKRPSTKGGDGACERKFGFYERSILKYNSFNYLNIF